MPRSTGIIFRAIFAAVGAISGLWTAVTIIAFGSLLGGFAIFYGGLGIVLALAGGALSYGLWTSKHWAWNAGLLIELLVLAYTVGVVMVTGMTDVISMAMAAAVVWYFFQSGVRDTIEQAQVTESKTKQS